MIYIEKDQKILNNENMRVASPTGNYNDFDFIEFYNIEKPNVIDGAYHAQYIKYGNLVYMFNDPKELGEAILAIDPESTHNTASFVRMQNELLSKLNEGSLEPESLQQVIDNEQEVMEEKIEESLKEETIEEEIIVEEPLVEEPTTEEIIIEEPVIEKSILIPETSMIENTIILPDKEVISKLKNKKKIT